MRDRRTLLRSCAEYRGTLRERQRMTRFRAARDTVWVQWKALSTRRPTCGSDLDSSNSPLTPQHYFSLGGRDEGTVADPDAAVDLVVSRC